MKDIFSQLKQKMDHRGVQPFDVFYASVAVFTLIAAVGIMAHAFLQ